METVKKKTVNPVYPKRISNADANANGDPNAYMETPL